MEISIEDFLAKHVPQHFVFLGYVTDDHTVVTRYIVPETEPTYAILLKYAELSQLHARVIEIINDSEFKERLKYFIVIEGDVAYFSISEKHGHANRNQLGDLLPTYFGLKGQIESMSVKIM